MSTTGRQFHHQMVHFIRKRITYANYGTVVDMGIIPAGASVVGGGVHVITAFNSSGTDLLDVGFRGGSTTDDPNGYATLLQLNAVGWIVLDELATTTNIQQSVDTIVTCSPAQSVADATAGVADVIIWYVPNTDG